MKISVSLPDEDVKFLDEHAAGNRSAALHEAVKYLRESKLTDLYAEAFEQWSVSPDAALWDNASNDGLAG